MAMKVLNIKMDAKLKAEVQKVAKEMGLPVSVLMNNAAKRIVEERSVVFRAPLVPNAKTAKDFRKAMADIKAGKHKKWPAFDSMEEMIDYLHKR